MLSAALPVAAGIVLVLSLAGIVLAAVDSRRAARGAAPPAEGVQLALALAGGWPGLALGRVLFEPLPREAGFHHALALATAVNLALVGGALLTAWVLDGGDPAAVAAALVDEALALARAAGAEETAALPELPRRFGPGS